MQASDPTTDSFHDPKELESLDDHPSVELVIASIAASLDASEVSPADRLNAVTTMAAIGQARTMCTQALKHLGDGDLFESAARLQLVNGMLSPALAWLLQSTQVVESDGTSSTPPEDYEFPGQYL